MSRRQRGYTVIELCIVLMVIATIVALAMPNFLRMMRVVCLNSSADQISKDLKLARMYATSRGQNAVVDFNVGMGPNVIDPKTDMQTAMVAGTSRLYELGVGRERPVLLLQRTLGSYVRFLEDPIAPGADLRYIYFDPQGNAHFPDSNGNDQFTVAITDGDQERHISVTQDGDIRIFETEVGGVWQDSDW